MGYPPAMPNGGPLQSHIITIGEIDAGGHAFSTDPKIEKLAAHLKACKVAHTIRRGQVRFVIHAFNDEADIHRVIDYINGMD